MRWSSVHNTPSPPCPLLHFKRSGSAFRTLKTAPQALTTSTTPDTASKVRYTLTASSSRQRFPFESFSPRACSLSEVVYVTFIIKNGWCTRAKNLHLLVNQVGHICWLAPPTLSLNLWQARIGLKMKHAPPLSHPPSPHLTNTGLLYTRDVKRIGCNKVVCYLEKCCLFSSILEYLLIDVVHSLHFCY